MRRSLPRHPAAALAGGALVVVAGLAGAVARRRAAPAPSPAVAAPPPPQDNGPPHGLTGEAQLPQTVADAYRGARRAFNAVRQEPTDAGRAEFRQAVWSLWAAATVAEPYAAAEGKALARGARELLCLLDEHRDLAGVAAASAAGPLGAAVGGHATRRRGALERKLVKRGRRLFASKPARVASRLAADHGR